MNTRTSNSRRARNQGGFAVIIMVALLAIMLLLLAANTATLNRLTQEVKGLEKHQIQRWNPPAKATPPTSPTLTNLPPAQP